MDVLSDVLSRAHASGAVFALSRLRGDWGVDLAATSGMTIHVVTRGEVWLAVDGEAEVRMLPGDVALTRHVHRHDLSSGPGVPTLPLAELEPWRVGRSDVFEVPGDEPPTELLCGNYRFDGQMCHGILAALPAVVHLRAGDGNVAPELRSIVALMADEVRADARGRSSVLDRLLDVLFVLVLRAWFERSAAAPPWYAALGDREVGRALELLHAEPARRWTVADLAGAVGVSRATLARRFRSLVGAAPLAYLTEWRLLLAAQQLRETERPIRAVARSVGYDNEFAFSTAFRKHMGTAPSKYRAAGSA